MSRYLCVGIGLEYVSPVRGDMYIYMRDIRVAVCTNLSAWNFKD